MAAGRILARLSLLCTFRWSAKHLLQSYAYKCKVLYNVHCCALNTAVNFYYIACSTERFSTNAQCSALMKRAIQCCTFMQLYSYTVLCIAVLKLCSAEAGAGGKSRYWWSSTRPKSSSCQQTSQHSFHAHKFSWGIFQIRIFSTNIFGQKVGHALDQRTRVARVAGVIFESENS